MYNLMPMGNMFSPASQMQAQQQAQLRPPVGAPANGAPMDPQAALQMAAMRQQMMGGMGMGPPRLPMGGQVPTAPGIPQMTPQQMQQLQQMMMMFRGQQPGAQPGINPQLMQGQMPGMPPQGGGQPGQ